MPLVKVINPSGTATFDYVVDTDQANGRTESSYSNSSINMYINGTESVSYDATDSKAAGYTNIYGNAKIQNIVGKLRLRLENTSATTSAEIKIGLGYSGTLNNSFYISKIENTSYDNDTNKYTLGNDTPGTLVNVGTVPGGSLATPGTLDVDIEILYVGTAAGETQTLKVWGYETATPTDYDINNMVPATVTITTKFAILGTAVSVVNGQNVTQVNPINVSIDDDVYYLLTITNSGNADTVIDTVSSTKIYTVIVGNLDGDYFYNQNSVPVSYGYALNMSDPYTLAFNTSVDIDTAGDFTFNLDKVIEKSTGTNTVMYVRIMPKVKVKRS